MKTKLLFSMMFTWHSELFASLPATSRENTTTIGGLHTKAETMLVNPLSVVGLECSFHLLFCILNMNLFVSFWGFPEGVSLKTSAKLVNFKKSAKEKTKNHSLFLSFSAFSSILTSSNALSFRKVARFFGISLTYSYLCTRFRKMIVNYKY